MHSPETHWRRADGREYGPIGDERGGQWICGVGSVQTLVTALLRKLQCENRLQVIAAE